MGLLRPSIAPLVVVYTPIPSPPSVQTPVVTLLDSMVQGGDGIGAIVNPTDTRAVINTEDSVYAVLVAFGTTGTAGGNPLTAALTYGGESIVQVASNKANLDATSPVVRLYRLPSAPTGSNAFQATLTSAQNVNSWGAALFSVANDGGVGPNLVQTIGDGSAGSETLNMTIAGSAAFGAYAVQGDDSLPFSQGAGYDELLESNTVSSGSGSNSADMGWAVQSDLSGAAGAKAFDASWSVADGFGVAAIEILGTGAVPDDALFFSLTDNELLELADGEQLEVVA